MQTSKDDDNKPIRPGRLSRRQFLHRVGLMMGGGHGGLYRAEFGLSILHGNHG